MHKRDAQSLLEYVLLASVTIAVVIVCANAFFGNKGEHSGGIAKAFYLHFDNMRQRMGVSSDTANAVANSPYTP